MRAMAEAALFPLDGELEAAGLSDAVTVERDAYGVPRITAASLRSVVPAGVRHGGRAALPAGAGAAPGHRAPVGDLRRADLPGRRLHAHDRAQPRGRHARRGLDRPRSRDARKVPCGRAGVDRGDAGKPVEYQLLDSRACHPRRPGAVRRGDRAPRVEPLEQLGRRAAARRARRRIPSRDHVLLLPASSRGGIGSNNRAVAGSRTASGKPLLAGDPHLLVAQPGTWFELHLRAPGYDARGVALPFLPGIILGATPHHAWTATNVTGDSQDLFEEQLNDDGTAARFGDAWEPLAIHEEPIMVRGEAEPRMLEVRESRHGRSSRTASRACRRPSTGRSSAPTHCDGRGTMRRFAPP